MLETGSMLGGRYRVLHDVGRGGAGHVYLVLNERAGKQWAAKEIKKEEDETRNALIADAEVLKKLHHPYIPSIVDIIETQEYYYVLMDFIEGRTLKEVLRDEGAQPQEKVVKWALELCDIFRYLHSRQPKIIFRDTKPANIMLKPNGYISLIDFGSAREYKPGNTDDTTNLGSRGYAAPEQYEGVGGQTDERTDIYNLGVTMYHLLTGHNPSQYPFKIYPIRHWDKTLSSGLEKIVLKCTQSNPDERYQTAEELTYALQRYRELDDGKIRERNRKKKLAAALVISGVCLLTGGVICTLQGNRLTEESYVNILKNAATATTKEAGLSLYKEAIQLKPAAAEGYEKLLEQFLSDDTFSKEESDTMTQILNTYVNGKTCEDALSRTADYGEFSYEMGLAYFYCYEGSGNKAMASPYFEIAAQDEALEESKGERATRLAKVSSYYNKLGKQSKSGDAEISYAQYWEDMDEATKDNIIEIDNAKTACVMYQELSYQIRMHANDFKRAGIKEDALSNKLAGIEAHLDTDLTESERTKYQDLIETIKSNIREAREAVLIAYEGQEG